MWWLMMNEIEVENMKKLGRIEKGQQKFAAWKREKTSCAAKDRLDSDFLQNFINICITWHL